MDIAQESPAVTEVQRPEESDFVLASTSRVITFLKNLRNRQFRNKLAYFSLSMFLLSVLWIAKIYFIDSGLHAVVDDRPYNDQIQAAIDIRLDQSNMLFQFVVIFLTAISSLLLAKKDEVVLFLEDFPELGMLLLALVSLAGSFTSHLIYVSKITQFLITASRLDPKLGFGLADIFAPEVDYLFSIQYVFLCTGVLITCLTFISAHRLK